MDRRQQVFVKLKLKAKALGFNAKELKGIAAKIADNLESQEDASEEDVNAEIDEKIEAVLPYLTFGQSQANRLLDEWKKNHPEAEPDDEPNDNFPNDTPKPASKKKLQDKEENKDEEPAWFKAYREQQDARFAALEGEKTSSLRKSKLESLLKDTGTFGNRTLKSFSKMNFENDEEFEQFLSEVEEDLKAYNQERADAGLSTLGTPPAAGTGKPDKEIELLTDAEIDSIVNNF